MIEGVRRPPALALGAGNPDTLGPRVCRGRTNVPALGVAAGSRDAIDAFLVGLGAWKGIGRIASGASDSGGEGGVESGRRASACQFGGVDAAVGEERFVLVVDASDMGERGRSVRESFARWSETLRWRCFSMVASASRSFSCVISDSIFKSDSSSRNRWVSMRSPSRSRSPILISSSSITSRSIATLYFVSMSSSDDVWLRVWRSMSSFCTSTSRSLSCRVRCPSRRLVISFWSLFCTLLASVLLCLYLVCNARQLLSFPEWWFSKWYWCRERTFHSSASKPSFSTFSCSLRSRFSLSSTSRSSSASSSLLDDWNSCSSASSVSYAVL